MAAATVVDEILRNNPLLRRDVVAHGRTWLVLNNRVVNIYGPLAVTDAQRIAAVDHVSQIQFALKFDVPVATLKRLDSTVLAAHPDVRLRETFNGDGAFDDLEPLRHLPRLRALVIDGNRALDLAPIATYVALASLGVGGEGTSLRPLHDYRSLEQLSVREHVTDFDTIGTLANLQRLTIADRCPARLGFLATLPRLRVLALDGAAPKRLDDLVAAPALEELSLSRVKLETAALAPIGSIARLVRLTLRDLPQVTSLGWLTNPRLEELALAKMTGLRSFAALASLPRLTTLTLDQTVTADQLAELTPAPALEVVRLRQSDLDNFAPVLAARSLGFRLAAI